MVLPGAVRADQPDELPGGQRRDRSRRRRSAPRTASTAPARARRADRPRRPGAAAGPSGEAAVMRSAVPMRPADRCVRLVRHRSCPSTSRRGRPGPRPASHDTGGSDASGWRTRRDSDRAGPGQRPRTATASRAAGVGERADQLLGVRQPAVGGGGPARPLHRAVRARPGSAARPRTRPRRGATRSSAAGDQPRFRTRSGTFTDGAGQHEEEHPAVGGAGHRAERQLHPLHPGQRQAARRLRDVQRVERPARRQQDRGPRLLAPHPADGGRAAAWPASAQSGRGRVRAGCRAVAGAARAALASRRRAPARRRGTRPNAVLPRSAPQCPAAARRAAWGSARLL